MKNSIKSRLQAFSLFLLSFVLFASVTACKNKTDNKTLTEEIKVQGEFQATLTAPPQVPPPVGNRAASKVYVDLEVIEKEMEMTDGTSYVYWTFGGTVPGSFIRIREGDEVVFNLKNHPDSKMPHNIDLHAVTGPGGGAEASFVAPGQQIAFSFKALNPGLYVYHCAAPPVGMHIANGMYGLILVEPTGGLPPVDKEFYVMQGDFYTKGKTGEKGLQPFSMEKTVAENADYVVFNGSMEALTGENALQAKIGETIRMFVGNGGPNLASSFHIIGEIMDRVYEGGTTINENVSTTLIPPGGAAIVEFKVDVPGELVFVDHSITRAFNKGALGTMDVVGPKQLDLFDDTYQQKEYRPNTHNPLDMEPVKSKISIPSENSTSEKPPKATEKTTGTNANIESKPAKEVEEAVEVIIKGNDQMQFDKSEIKVKAGQTVALILKHTGKLPKEVMGHNVVILKSGTDVGKFAAAAIGAPDNDYTPKNSDEVIAYTPIIGGGEETTVRFEAPAKGAYTFICSFPGHYTVMRGTLIVE